MEPRATMLVNLVTHRVTELSARKLATKQTNVQLTCDVTSLADSVDRLNVRAIAIVRSTITVMIKHVVLVVG